MGGDCFNCADGPVSEAYRLAVESVGVFEHKHICRDCVREFREVDWIEIQDPVTSMRSGEASQAEKSP